VIIVSGCDALEPTTHEDPRQLSLDVVVSAAALRIYANGTDLTCECDDSDWDFAAIDACVDWDDVIACSCYPAMSCLSARVIGDGIDATNAGTLPFYFALPSTTSTNLTLSLSGCGHDETKISIAAFEAPPPVQLDVSVAEQTITAMWQAAGSSAIVDYAFGFSGRACHTTATSHSYVVPGTSFPIYAAVYVTPYLAEVSVPSPFGEVRIWRAGNTEGMQLP
jgi:hypothetical protein